KFDTDLFFVGKAKDRLDEIISVYDRAVEHNIKCLFYLFDVDENDVKYREGVHYNVWLDYTQILNLVSKSKCLLEVAQKGTSGFTLRSLEAITYNKLLLTSNDFIKTLKYYNTDYIQIYNDVNDIDFGFIMKQIDIDYQYLDDFSPKKLLEFLEKKLYEGDYHD
ncbi:MAG: hypothetical protein U1C51_07570, partial [Candidatus Izemoplasmatales bacterium]|nr:hypothetical protein [Candidatus Izemoplasmatales bacterium]